MKIGILVLTALFVFSGTAFAAEQKTASSSNAARFTEADYQAAYKLFDAMDIPQTLDDSIRNMLNLQLRANPMLNPVRDIMKKFFRKYLNYDAIKKDYANIYLEDFSAKELNELTKFYKTPLGAKIARKNASISLRCAELGQRIVMAHMQELQQEVIKEMQKSVPKQNPVKK